MKTLTETPVSHAAVPGVVLERLASRMAFDPEGTTLRAGGRFLVTSGVRLCLGSRRASGLGLDTQEEHHAPGHPDHCRCHREGGRESTCPRGDRPGEDRAEGLPNAEDGSQ